MTITNDIKRDLGIEEVNSMIKISWLVFNICDREIAKSKAIIKLSEMHDAGLITFEELSEYINIVKAEKHMIKN